MLNQTIKYLSFYVPSEDASDGRIGAPAARDKMDYIIHCLVELGFRVQVVSAAQTSARRTSASRTIPLGDDVSLHLLPSLKYGGWLSRAIRVVHRSCSVFFYLTLRTRRHENVLVYHSLGYVRPVLWAHRLRRFRLILEAEEVYADVTGRIRDRRLEQRIFRRASAFLFPTEMLNSLVNLQDRPHLVVHGVYQLSPGRDSRFDDGRIHVVYAGTFDPRKGGAMAAAAAAAYLDERFHIHILGFGSPKDTENMTKEIARISKLTSCQLTFHGLLEGEEYSVFLRRCHIGLSTQQSSAAFNETSFPSKVLSYLSHGLHVVSVRTRALEESSVGDLLHYYDGDSPETIASAIMRVDASGSYDPRTRLRELDQEFRKSIESLLYP